MSREPNPADRWKESIRKLSPFLRPRPETTPVGGNVLPAYPLVLRQLPRGGVFWSVIGTGEQEVLPADPRRQSVMFSYVGDSTPVFARAGDNPKGCGINLDPSGVPLILTRKKMGELITQAWYVGPFFPPVALTVSVYVQDTYLG